MQNVFHILKKKKKSFYCTVLVSKASLLVLCCVSEGSHVKHLKGVIFCKLKGQT